MDRGKSSEKFLYISVYGNPLTITVILLKTFQFIIDNYRYTSRD